MVLRPINEIRLSKQLLICKKCMLSSYTAHDYLNVMTVTLSKRFYLDVLEFTLTLNIELDCVALSGVSLGDL